MKRIFDFIFVNRPMLIIPVWTIQLLGYARAGIADFDRDALIGLLSSTLASGAVFILNQMCDIESDRINRKGQFFTQGLITIREGIILYIFENGIALILAGLISGAFFFGIMAVVILGALYSLPPFNLKNRPFAALFVNALGHGSLVFMLGWIIGGGRYWPGLINSTPYFLAVAAIYLGTTIPDIKGDKESRKITLAVKWGEHACKWVVFGFVISAMAAAAILRDWRLFAASLPVLLFQIAALAEKGLKWQVLAIKISIITLSLAATIKFPLYIIWLGLVILGTRLYHRYKFNMSYPSIAP